jgi:hypothetical protein
METVYAYKILVSKECPDEELARTQYEVPDSVPYLGEWLRPEGKYLLHLFSTSPREIFEGWGWVHRP